MKYVAGGAGRGRWAERRGGRERRRKTKLVRRSRICDATSARKLNSELLRNGGAARDVRPRPASYRINSGFVFIRLYEFPRPRVAISRLSRSYLGKNSPPRLANFRGERAICRWGSGKRSDTYASPPSTNSFLPLNVTATVFTHFCSPFPLRFHSLRCALIVSPRIRIFRKPNRGRE